MTVSLRQWPVALYVPNLIGYLRVILSAIAIANYRAPWTFLTYYSIGFVLDGADGLTARMLDQSSYMGAQFDMLTDRCATAALLTLLATLYESLAPLYVALIFLDGYSHWMQMLAGACAGTASHKQASRGQLLNFYYWRPVLTIVCGMNETTFLALYMLYFTDGPIIYGSLTLFNALFYVCVPVCILKQVVSLRQIVSAHDTITESIS